MKVYEVLNFNMEILKKLLAIGIKIDDCKYIDMYNDYCNMQRHGYKTTYIIAHLANKYNISERKVYMTIRKYEKDCTDFAAG